MAQLKIVSSTDAPRQSRIAAYFPEEWNNDDAKKTALHALDRFVNRDMLYGPERIGGVTLSERRALLRILAHCKMSILSRVERSNQPSRQHIMVAFRTGHPGVSLHDEALAPLSGSELDPILVPVDRKPRTPNMRRNFDPDLNIPSKGERDRFFVVLETGHNLALPLTAQRVKKLKRIRNDLRKAAEETLQRSGIFYRSSSPYQRRMENLAADFDTLISGITRRANAPKPHKSQNKMSKARRHSAYLHNREVALEDTNIALRLGAAAHPNRLRSQESSKREKGPERKARARKSLIKGMNLED